MLSPNYDMLLETRSVFLREDMIPATLHSVNALFAFGYSLYTLKPISQHVQMKVWNTGARRQTLLGPFNTTGGFSWLVLNWRDVGNLSSLLSKRPGPVGVSALGGPIDAAGNTIPLPPLHVHHWNMDPMQVVPERTGRDHHQMAWPSLSDCLLGGSCDGYNFMNDIVIGGDTCKYPCYLGALPISSPLSFQGIFNDIRVKDSVLMSWYFWVDLRISNDFEPLVSRLYSHNPSPSWTQPGITTPISTMIDSLSYNVVSMPFAGTASACVPHTHGLTVTSLFLFVARPQDIPLAALPAKPWEAIPLHTLGFDTLASARKHLYVNLSPICVHDTEVYPYLDSWVDAAARPVYIDHRIEAGDPLLTVALHGRSALVNDTNFLTHFWWNFIYMADHGAHNTWGAASQTENAFDPMYSRFDIAMYYMNGGTVQEVGMIEPIFAYAFLTYRAILADTWLYWFSILTVAFIGSLLFLGKLPQAVLLIASAAACLLLWWMLHVETFHTFAGNTYDADLSKLMPSHAQRDHALILALAAANTALMITSCALLHKRHRDSFRLY